METQEIKTVVKERYGGIARQSEESKKSCYVPSDSSSCDNVEYAKSTPVRGLHPDPELAGKLGKVIGVDFTD